MYSIDIQHEKEILEKFYEAVYKRDEVVCLAPALTNYFNWFMDIDLKQSTPISIQYVREICRIVVTTVSSFYQELRDMPYTPGTPEWDDDEGVWLGAGEGRGRLRFAIATSGWKEGKNPKTDKIEYGIGIHPYSIGRLICTREQAQLMRIAIIDNCISVLGERLESQGFNPWDQVFDSGVYKGFGGTRILGSAKVFNNSLFVFVTFFLLGQNLPNVFKEDRSIDIETRTTAHVRD